MLIGRIMDEEQTLFKLSAVLGMTHTFPRGSELFLPPHRPWNGDTTCAVVYVEDEDDPDDVPFAQAHGLSWAFSITDVQDIIENARQQDPNIDTERLVQAVQFYFDHDAFIDLNHLASS